MAVDEILKELNSVKTRALRSLKMVRGRAALENARLRYLGHKGLLAGLNRHIASLEPEAKALASQIANGAREAILQALAEKERQLAACEQEAVIAEEAVDATLPGDFHPAGRLHPLTSIVEEIRIIFSSMGFAVATGPEIETDYHNFQALNMPALHPDRDRHAGLYVGKETLLRTHLAATAARALLDNPPPVALICFGRAYKGLGSAEPPRGGMEIAGVMASETVRFGDLKGVLSAFIGELFGSDTETRMRPAYCPFTEPSCVLDILIRDPRAGGVHTDEPAWMEIISAGMVHPAVLDRLGYHPARVSGFAFAADIELLALLKYQTPSAEYFYENDARFLKLGLNCKAPL